MDLPEKTDNSKAAFRKPTNDTANRKYRRRSSTSLSPPPGSPERRGYRSQNASREDSSIINSDDGRTIQKDNRERDQRSGRNSKSEDLDRHDRASFRDSRGYKRHADGDRDHSRLSDKSGNDSSDRHYRDYERMKNENEYKRSRDGDKYSHTRYTKDSDSHKSKYTEGRSSSLSVEKDMHAREKDDRYENRGSRTAWSDNRMCRSLYDDAKASHNDLAKSSGCGSNETDVVDCERPNREDKKSFDYRESKRTRDRDSRESRVDIEDQFGFTSQRTVSPLKKLKLTNTDKSCDLKTSELSERTAVPINVNDVDNTNNLDAAKVAALRAAELVNKNLVGVGVVGALSTDQKKKLLWGSKKKAVEESGHCWDASLFPDREQQEKFNRLMGVKGEVKAEQKAGNPEGKSILDPEKQKELQQDLEKQYTAGLRRRDGRTVGLGL